MSFKFLGGQLRQYPVVDRIIAKRGGVLFKPQFAQPLGGLDRHRRGSRHNQVSPAPPSERVVSGPDASAINGRPVNIDLSKINAVGHE
jgi:hypothetical protein